MKSFSHLKLPIFVLEHVEVFDKSFYLLSYIRFVSLELRHHYKGSFCFLEMMSFLIIIRFLQNIEICSFYSKSVNIILAGTFYKETGKRNISKRHFWKALPVKIL